MDMPIYLSELDRRLFAFWFDTLAFVHESEGVPEQETQASLWIGFDPRNDKIGFST